MACMAENPHLQEKVAEVVEGVVGHDRMPLLSDRSSLKYVDSFVMETLRYASAAPIGVPRKATRDVNFREYTSVIVFKDSIGKVAASIAIYGNVKGT